MTDIYSAERFLTDYGPDYRDLLSEIKGICIEIQKTLGDGIIEDIYTRADSTGGKSEFKDPAGIARKVRQRGERVEVQSFLKLNDIVGMTVVVYYPDQLDLVVEEVTKCLASKQYLVSKPERHKQRNGYFATHLSCSKAPKAEALFCEIQFKTMLHNAWSAKMHDLTYKPVGMLDPRLSALMASVADTIESVENQSILIRDMIQAGWNVEELARREARRQLFDDMLFYKKIILETKNKLLVDLHDDIEQRSKIISTEPLTHPDISDLIRRVDAICSDASLLRYCWMMAGRIASLRPTLDLSRFFSKHASSWLNAARPLLTDKKIWEGEISAVPIVFYVIGDLDRAIDCASTIRENSQFKAILTPIRLAGIDFNQATFLIEREYHFPTHHATIRAELRKRIDDLLGAPELRAAKEMESSLLDTEGLAKITFAETKDQVRRGIEDCVTARSLAPDTEKEVARAYADLNMRLGWRRYFELEAREITPRPLIKRP